MRQTTLCLLLKDGSILLAMKKRGFGMGKWNGYGGKLLDGESVEQAALREMEEEIGVTAELADLDKVGILNFHFPHRKEWDQAVNIFLVRNWSGVPKESEEMMPQWFKLSDIPYEHMWPDDKYWLPKVLENKRVTGTFYFNEEGTDFTSFELKEHINLDF